MKRRHRNHDAIVDALLKNELPKVIAGRLKVKLSTVYDIKNKFLEYVPKRKFDPGEGQLHFFNFWTDHKQ